MGGAVPAKITFRETLRRSVAAGVILETDSENLKRLMELRNPLSHFRGFDDPSNLMRRMLNDGVMVEEHLRADASYALSMAVRLLSLPSFRVDQ